MFGIDELKTQVNYLAETLISTEQAATDAQHGVVNLQDRLHQTECTVAFIKEKISSNKVEALRQAVALWGAVLPKVIELGAKADDIKEELIIDTAKKFEKYLS